MNPLRWTNGSKTTGSDRKVKRKGEFDMEKLEPRKGGKALYLQIKDIYRQRILDGDLQPGDKIESEMEIQRIYGVSRITARQAILGLEKEGMVNRGRGRGTFVIWKPGIQESLDEIRSFTDEMMIHGRTPGLCSNTGKVGHPDETFIEAFGLDPNEKFYILKRVRTADDIKLVYMISCFPTQLEADYEGGSVYEYQGLPYRVEEEFSARLPQEDVIRALNIAKTQPVMVRSRIGYDQNGAISEYTLCYYRGDLYTCRHSAVCQKQAG